MARIFVSYAREDKEIVRQIVDILQDAGQEPWFDHALLPGRPGRGAEWDRTVRRVPLRAVGGRWHQVVPMGVAEAVKMSKPVIGAPREHSNA
jgi:hypothetical protein